MANLGTVPGDPDAVTVSTTDPDLVTIWPETSVTDLTREAAEELAGLLMRAVRELGGCPRIWRVAEPESAGSGAQRPWFPHDDQRFGR